MSGKVSGWVWDLDLPRNMKYVLLAYADHADHYGKNVYPGISKMAEKTGYSRRQVQYMTRQLEEQGYLIPDGSGPHGTNKWRIPVPQEWGGAEFAPPYVGGAEKDEEGVQKTQEGVQKNSGGGAIAVAPEPSFNHHIKPSVEAEEGATATTLYSIRDAERLIIEATGISYCQHVPTLQNVLSLINKYDYDPTKDAVRTAFQEWRSKKGEKTGRRYSAHNYGYIEWAEEILMDGPGALHSQKDPKTMTAAEREEWWKTVTPEEIARL